MTLVMAYALKADTWGTCIIATTRVVVSAEFLVKNSVIQSGRVSRILIKD